VSEDKKVPGDVAEIVHADPPAPIAAPKQFIPLPPKAIPRNFSALAIHPGDVLLIDVPQRHTEGREQFKARPWIVMSTNRAHRAPLDLVVAIPLTSKLHRETEFREMRIRIPKHFIHTTDARFKHQDSLALTEHVRSLSLERCIDKKKVGQIDPEAVSSLKAALRYLFGLGIAAPR